MYINLTEQHVGMWGIFETRNDCPGKLIADKTKCIYVGMNEDEVNNVRFKKILAGHSTPILLEKI